MLLYEIIILLIKGYVFFFVGIALINQTAKNIYRER